VYLTKIEDAYIGARYLPRRYEKNEVKTMLDFVKEVFKKLSREFEVYIESGRKALEQLKKYTEIGREVKRIVNEVLGDVKVYVFGSVVEGRYTAMGDIDMLIVVNNMDRKEIYKVKAIIYKNIDAPIELHVASNDEFENWYKRFIHKLEEVV
jgi:predicted nucleotidyltransferase